MLKREKQETKLEKTKHTTLPIPLGEAATGHYEARFYLLLITTERLKSLLELWILENGSIFKQISTRGSLKVMVFKGSNLG
jgi:hypothetical protein